MANLLIHYLEFLTIKNLLLL